MIDIIIMYICVVITISLI